MKLLHVIPGLAMRYGGPSQAVHQMCRTLRLHGHETVICTTNADGPSVLPVSLNRIEPFQNLPTIFFSRQFTEAYKYSRPLAQWLGSNVKGFDVVHIHAVFSHSSLAAARACRKYRVPYVVRPLGSLSSTSLNQKRFRKLMFWHLGVRRMLRDASAIQYATVEEKRLAESYLGLKNGVVIPLGIDENVLRGTQPAGPSANALYTDGPYVLVLSRLHPIKGLELLLEAFTSLVQRNEFNNWRLIIAGDGDPKYVSTLKNKVAQTQAREQVEFRGWVDGSDKFALLKNASVLALPSRHENFGLCLIESLACGVPVIVSPHVNLAQEIQAAGVGWVTHLEYDALKRTLTEILSDEKGRSERGALGKGFVAERFTWRRVGEQLAALYASVTEDGFKSVDPRMIASPRLSFEVPQSAAIRTIDKT